MVPDSLPPHGLQPTRLLCPLDFSGKDYWSGLPFPSPGDLPNPGIEPRSPALQADSLPTELQSLRVKGSEDTRIRVAQNDFLLPNTLNLGWSFLQKSSSMTIDPQRAMFNSNSVQCYLIPTLCKNRIIMIGLSSLQVYILKKKITRLSFWMPSPQKKVTLLRREI